MTSYRKLKQQVDSLQQDITGQQEPEPEPPPSQPARPPVRLPSVPLSPRILPVAFVAGVVFERLTYISARAARNSNGTGSGGGALLEKCFSRILPLAEVFLRAYMDSPPPERRDPPRR